MKPSLTAEANLISSLVSIEKFIPVLEGYRQSTADAEAELKRMIDEYKKERFNLFKARLCQKKKGWCTIDKHLASLSGLKFLFTTGKRWHTSHESDSLRAYAELHRACPTCRKRNLEMSGSGDGKAYQYAFPAKKKGKGFLWKKYRVWLPLPDEAKTQEIPGYALTKELAAELGLPKAINYTCSPFAVTTDA